MDLRRQTECIGFVQQSPDNQIVTDKVWHELAFGLESLGYTTREIHSRVAEMASFFGIQTWFHKEVTELSGGQKQLLNLASVMVMQPKVLVLDEPTSQLDPIAAADFLATIKKLNRELGTTVILTEHRLEEALPISDRVLVMDEGCIIADGTPEEVGKKLKELSHDMFTAMPTPMKIYAAVENDFSCPVTVKDGREWVSKLAEVQSPRDIAWEKRRQDQPETPIIQLEEVWFRYQREAPDIVKGLSVTINRGELFAIVGGNGTGKTTSLSIISGLLMPYRGTVKVKGKPMEKGGILLNNMGVLPQNPQALFVKKTVELDLYEMFSGRKMGKEIQRQRVDYVTELCELEPLLGMHPYDLSGGEQQRAALAKILLLNPEILLLDEPTKGLDGHFKEKLAEIFGRLQMAGTTIVMVSHDIEFCASYADRCAMFFDGGITSIDEPRAFFCGKSFYTTAANRMARRVLPRAVLAEDVILAFNGKVPKKNSIGDGLKNKEHIHKLMDFEKNQGRDGQLESSQEKKTPQQGKKTISRVRILASVGCWIGFIVTALLFWGKYVDYKNYLIQFTLVLFMGGGLATIFPGNNIEAPDYSVQVEKEKRKLDKRTVAALIMVFIAIPLTIYVGVFYLGDRKYYFISLLVMVEAMLPFALLFEGKKPQARELMVIAVLCAIAVAGRAAFFMLPQFKPVIAVVIIAGVCFGGETGFLVGAMTAFVSNMMFGQGPLTPWQMFAYGMVGLVAGVLFQKGFLRKKRTALCIFGAIMTFFVCGVILDTGSCLAWQANPTFSILLTYYMTGVPFNIIHAFATAFFLWFISEPMIEKLDRIKTKYGLL
ncbi:MAG: ATP-binding cassette domain-containing protein [Anaerovorax sp.]